MQPRIMFGGIGKSEGRLESKAKIRDSVQKFASCPIQSFYDGVKMALLSQIVMYTVHNMLSQRL